MSYEKLGFESGQVLKAEHLNHIEEGIAAMSGGFPTFKKSELTRGQAVELAKNKTVCFLEQITDTAALNHFIIKYEVFPSEEGDCGDMTPPRLELQTERNTFPYDISEDEFDEILAAWEQ